MKSGGGRGGRRRDVCVVELVLGAWGGKRVSKGVCVCVRERERERGRERGLK